MKQINKRIISLTLCFLLLTSFLMNQTTVFGQDLNANYPSQLVKLAKLRAETFLTNIGRPLQLEEGTLLKNINGEFEAVSFNFPTMGYIIVNIKDMSIPELSFKNSNPFNGVQNPVFNGPLSYYSMVGSDFISLKGTKHIKREQFDYEYCRPVKPFTKLTSGRLEDSAPNAIGYGITEKYLRGSLKVWTSNCESCCGAIASAICMRYYYDYVSTSYVPRASIERIELISLMQKYVGEALTHYGNVTNGLNNYFRSMKINNTANVTRVDEFLQIKTEINRNRPIIIGMIQFKQSGGHWCVAYGYFDSKEDGKYVIVNDADGRTDVWIQPISSIIDGSIYFTN
ncbi:C39 family peptidase [Guggenheimella bovis]